MTTAIIFNPLFPLSDVRHRVTRHPARPNLAVNPDREVAHARMLVTVTTAADDCHDHKGRAAACVRLCGEQQGQPAYRVPDHQHHQRKLSDDGLRLREQSDRAIVRTDHGENVTHHNGDYLNKGDTGSRSQAVVDRRANCGTAIQCTGQQSDALRPLKQQERKIVRNDVPHHNGDDGVREQARHRPTAAAPARPASNVAPTNVRATSAIMTSSPAVSNNVAGAGTDWMARAHCAEPETVSKNVEPSSTAIRTTMPGAGPNVAAPSRRLRTTRRPSPRRPSGDMVATTEE